MNNSRKPEAFEPGDELRKGGSLAKATEMLTATALFVASQINEALYYVAFI